MEEEEVGSEEVVVVVVVGVKGIATPKVTMMGTDRKKMELQMRFFSL